MSTLSQNRPQTGSSTRGSTSGGEAAARRTAATPRHKGAAGIHAATRAGGGARRMATLTS